MDYELKKVLGLIDGKVILMVNREKKEFSFGRDVAVHLNGKYVINSISEEGGTVIITLDRDTNIPNDMNADWVKEHVARFGKEPNPFDEV